MTKKELKTKILNQEIIDWKKIETYDKEISNLIKELSSKVYDSAKEPMANLSWYVGLLQGQLKLIKAVKND